jgi:hypothetical protein
MKRIMEFWKSGCFGKIAIIFVSVVLCGFCGLIANAISPSGSESTAIATSVEIVSSSTSEPEHLTNAIELVASNLEANNLGIESKDLLSKENPNGKGVFVYVEQTRFSGVERYIIWLVLDNVPYPLNGATKDIIPSLIWPREAPEDVWAKTNLDQYQATEAIEIVFGK